jgi:hypothetical protein
MYFIGMCNFFKVFRIQREFLWGGIKGSRKISWVKWRDVCLPRSQGGLGVRDVGKVNSNLLIKWRWKLLEGEDAVWKDILVAKYGSIVRHKVHWSGSEISNRSSCWWKDLCSVDLHDGVSWFANNVTRKIGMGSSTLFWKDSWLGHRPLCDIFPRLFSISSQKDGRG